jgi:predicted DNA-binding transcriptional regulator YafY
MSKFKFPRRRYSILDSLFRRHGIFYTIDSLLDIIYEKTGEEISKSTIDKDLRAMKEEFNAPIYYDHLNKGYTYKNKTFTIDQFPITEGDKEVLGMAYQVFRALKGTPLLKKLEGTIDKILLSSEMSSINTKDGNNILQIEEPLSESGTHWLETIYRSILERSALQIVYQVFGKEPRIKIISPYILREYRNRWYVVAYDHNSTKEYKTLVYALDRIKLVETTNQKYKIDPDFNASDYFKYSFGVYHSYENKPAKVKLEFYKPLIDYILSEPLHPSQKSQLSKDGNSLLVEMEVYLSEELFTMIRGYGNKVKVLKPKVLIDYINLEANQVSEMYH